MTFDSTLEAITGQLPGVMTQIAGQAAAYIPEELGDVIRHAQSYLPVEVDLMSAAQCMLFFAAISLKLKKKEAAGADASVNVNMKSVFPWFILGFLALSGLTSLGLIPGSVSSALKTLSKFLMVAALGAVGLNTDFKALCKSGAKPMLHGFIISLLVVLVAIGVEYMLGIAPTGNLF